MRLEESIGDNIRRAREARGMTQERLGEAMTIVQGKSWTRQAVSAAEKGRRGFPAAELCGFAHLLKVPVRALLDPRDTGPVEVAGMELPWQTLFGDSYDPDAREVLAKLKYALISANESYMAAKEAATAYDEITKDLWSVVTMPVNSDG